MPRKRTIKPDFFLDEDIANLGTLSRLLFIGLWGLADREGRLEDRPKRIKVQVFPYEDRDVDTLLWELAERFIVRYEFERKRYIQIEKFTKHQSPHPKEAKSTIEGPKTDGAIKLNCKQFKATARNARQLQSKTGLTTGLTTEQESKPDGLSPTQRPDANPEKLGATPKSPAKAPGSDRSPEPMPTLERAQGRALRLSCFLRNLILDNDPKAPVPMPGYKSLKAWNRDADLLLRKDKRPLDEAVKLLRWCQDSDFWRGNILSMGKFRKQYTQLLHQMKRDDNAVKVPVCQVCEVRKPTKDLPACEDCSRCSKCGGGKRLTIRTNPNGTKRVECKGACPGKAKSPAPKCDSCENGRRIGPDEIDMGPCPQCSGTGKEKPRPRKPEIKI